MGAQIKEKTKKIEFTAASYELELFTAYLSDKKNKAE